MRAPNVTGWHCLTDAVEGFAWRRTYSASVKQWHGPSGVQLGALSGRRGGYMLIELMATMGLTTAVITLLAAWLTTAMHNQRAAGEHLLLVNVQEHLARQFRQDVHAAQSILPLDLDADPDQRLRLDFGSHEVRYVRMNRHLERLEQTGDEVRRHEQYQLPPDQIRFETDEGAPQSTITMLLGKRPLRIEAVLGSDRRFERIDE